MQKRRPYAIADKGDELLAVGGMSRKGLPTC